MDPLAGLHTLCRERKALDPGLKAFIYRHSADSHSFPCAILCCASNPINEWVVGLSGVEPLTSPLSGVRSNQLSYRPVWHQATLACALSFFWASPSGFAFRPLPSPASFVHQRFLVELTGIEPVTS